MLRSIALLALSYVLGHIIYNLYFHPLRKYPGPFLARCTLLWRFKHSLGGRFHRVLEDCHKQYGVVFRVSPNELSFASPEAFRAIYTPKMPGGIAKIPKSEFYDMFGAGFDIASLGTERDPKLAHQKRELFAGALSAKGLAQQESTIQRTVDLWITKLGKLGAREMGVDMRDWFIYFGFDLTAIMSFGMSFHCIEREAGHEWLDLMLGHLHAITLMDNVRRIPGAVPIARCIPSKWTVGIRDLMVKYAKERTAARLEHSEQRGDFMENCANKVRAGKLSEEEMASHASNMALAGGETTGTAMTGITYYLLRDKKLYAKLNQEVREAFSSYNAITIASTSQLPFLQAVLKEGMRLFPTAPQGTPRISPGVLVEGHWVPKGTEFYVSPWATSHSEHFFHEPYVFKPDRWTDPTCMDNKDASQPFSVGPRACPGKLFAMAQMSLQLAKMVYMYDMELLDPEMDWEPRCRMHFLWHKPQLLVRFYPREI